MKKDTSFLWQKKAAFLVFLVSIACLLACVASFAADDQNVLLGGEEEVFASGDVAGGGIDTSLEDEVYMLKSDLEMLKVYSLERISIGDPNVADIASLEGDKILLVATEAGSTPIFLWDAKGKRTVMVYVFNRNLELIKERVKNLLGSAKIEGVSLEINEKEGKVVLTGDIHEDQRTHFDQLVGSFDADLINLVKDEKAEDLIQIDMQITELNATLLQSLGIDWTTGSNTSTVLTYQETLPDMDGSISDFFKIGNFRRSPAFTATVNAMVREGKGRILSKPKLVVVSGEEASFLVGGEIPIRTTTASSTGTSQENVSFKSYGISMAITPTIKKGKIDIVLNTEISDIDSANAVGDDVAFTSRSASTKLILDDRQTIVLAGLIKHNEGELIKKVPFLGDVPILGLIFRNKSMPSANTDTELVISLTPTILNSEQRNVAPLAGDEPTQRPRTVFAPTTVDPTTPIPAGMAEYVSQVQQKISAAVVYPSEAVESGWEGTVKVGMLILPDGTLAYSLIKESSGREIFDEYALKTTQQVSPFDPFPANANLQELNVTIPIVYSTTRN